MGEVEVIFVSADESEKDMIAYMNELHGAWLGVEHNSEMAEKLGRHFGATAIPNVVATKKNMAESGPDILGKDWTTVTKGVVSAIREYKDDPEKTMDEIFTS